MAGLHYCSSYKYRKPLSNRRGHRRLRGEALLGSILVLPFGKKNEENAGGKNLLKSKRSRTTQEGAGGRPERANQMSHWRTLYSRRA